MGSWASCCTWSSQLSTAAAAKIVAASVAAGAQAAAAAKATAAAVQVSSCRAWMLQKLCCAWLTLAWLSYDQYDQYACKVHINWDRGRLRFPLC